MIGKYNKIAAFVIAALMLATAFALPALANEEPKGFDGVSWKPVVPLKRATLVGFDTDSYTDDFAYMASVPANVFEKDGVLYSNPLLYYQPPLTTGGQTESLNAYKGTSYLWDDWTGFCDGAMDQVQLINIDNTEFELKAEETVKISDDDPYALAAKIAMENWGKSDVAVVAAIDDSFSNINEMTSDVISGTLPGEYMPDQKYFENSREVGILPQYNNFTVDSKYRYVVADMTWDYLPGIVGEIPSPLYGIDPDMQLYDFSLGQVSASEGWMSASEYCEAYAYNPGEWSAAVTYMPTKNGFSAPSLPETGEPIASSAPSAQSERGVTGTQPEITTANYRINISLYPGDEYQLPVDTPYSCRDATFRLTWGNTDAELGFVVRGPSSAEIGACVETGKASQELILNKMGEGSYNVTILKLNDFSGNVDFQLEYGWTQLKNKAEGEALESAAEGAVLASLINAPLLYTDFEEIPDVTADALDSLGVKDIYFVNLGGHCDDDAEGKLRGLGDVTEYDDYKEIYSKIQSITGQNDLVFTTVDPWSYWLAEELQPAGEEPYATYIGPAAFYAAHHGSPVMVVDTHPELSCSAAWHTNDWLEKAPTRDFPSVAGMVLTGKQVYNFVNESGFDGEGKESMITVAGQFDIGVPWDRVFPGAAHPGRIMGTPVDASTWISRNVFYPALVFQNPAMMHGAARITGSHSDIDPQSGALQITPGGEVMVDYPVLQTWVSYNHRFNERASSYWGLDYTTTDGITPFRQESPDAIDNGATAPYQEGQYYPDMTSSEVIPYYMNKMGYDSVFSTAFEPTMENLNRGMLMWIEVMHGGQSDSGIVGFWYDEVQPEKNPWRAYEEGGSTSEPDSVCMSRQAAADAIPSSPATGHDGVVITVASQLTQTVLKDGYGFDAALENAHSAGFMGGSCLISNTLLHLSLVRHGFAFQVIDPWVTSWYSAFAFESMAKYMALGDSIGEAYEKAILHVGIGYMADSWWWDISENVEFFGDPDLMVYSPDNGWDEPTPVSASSLQAIGGHKLVSDAEISRETPGFEVVVAMMAIGLIALLGAVRKR